MNSGIKKRKICVFSGKRGGFGAYLPLARLIESDPELELQILLGDMHAAEQFGKTAGEAAGYFPKAKIEVMETGAGRGDTPIIRAENLGECLKQSAAILSWFAPDIVMVHGDRGEHLAVALAALNLGMVVTHSQGGEISGNIDDVLRHAITKLAHLHFPETESAAERIRKMGEEEWRVSAVGSLYIDRIVKKTYPPFDAVKDKFGLGEGENYLIIIYHPDTFESGESNYRAAKNIFATAARTGCRSVVIYPCSDPGYDGVLKAIAELSGDPRFLVYKNIDNLEFLSIMERARAIIGNSSCAIKEAPYFYLPAINVGKREMDREREANVVDAAPDAVDIGAKLNFILTDSSFRSSLRQCGRRLGEGNASEKILAIIKRTPIDEKLLRKRLSY